MKKCSTLNHFALVDSQDGQNAGLRLWQKEEVVAATLNLKNSWFQLSSVRWKELFVSKSDSSKRMATWASGSQAIMIHFFHFQSFLHKNHFYKLCLLRILFLKKFIMFPTFDWFGRFRRKRLYELVLTLMTIITFGVFWGVGINEVGNHEWRKNLWFLYLIFKILFLFVLFSLKLNLLFCFQIICGKIFKFFLIKLCKIQKNRILQSIFVV